MCNISPREGIAFETEFTISCLSNNFDLDSYQFLITNGTHQIELSSGRKRAFFTRIGFIQNSKLQVRTRDVWNSEKIVEFPILIKHPKQVYQGSAEFSQYLTKKIQDLLNEEISVNTLGHDYINTFISFMSVIGSDNTIIQNYEYRNELSLSFLDVLVKIVQYANKNKDSSYMGRILPTMNQFLQLFTNIASNNRDKVFGLVNSTLDILQDYSLNYPSGDASGIYSVIDRIIPFISADLKTVLFNKLRIVNQQNLFDKLKNGYVVSNFSNNPTLQNYQVVNLNILGRKIYEPINIHTLSLTLPQQIAIDSLNSLFEVSAIIYTSKLTRSPTSNYVQISLTKNSIPLESNLISVNVSFPLQLNKNNVRAQCRSFSTQEEPKNHTTIQLDSSVVCVVALNDLNRNLYIDTYDYNWISPSEIVKAPLITDNTLLIVLTTTLSGVGLTCICCSFIFLLYCIGRHRKRNDSPKEYTYKASGSLSPIGISDHSSSDKHSDTSSSEQHNQNSSNSSQKVVDLTNLELLNGQYQLLEVLSIHSNYTLYKANNITTNQVVSIKKIGFTSFEEINSPTSVIVKEYSNMSKTKHSNIVKLYEVFVDTNIKAVCLALEYFELGNLNQLLLKKIQQNQIFEESHIGQILYQLSQALSYLHDECEMCHRNIRLENVYVRNNSPQKIEVCLGEFTNSRSRNSLKIEHDIQDQSFGSTMSSYKFGNFTKALKENSIKYTSDIFTSEDVFELGCLMYKVMSFDTESNISTLLEDYDFEQDVFKMLESRIHSSYSREIVSIVLSMLARDEKSRPTMNQVTNLLGNVFKFETQ